MSNTTEQDVKVIMEAIEELVLNSHKVPIANKLMVDEAKLFDLLDNLRQKLPTEMSESKQIVQNKSEIIGQAKKQSQDIISQAQEASRIMLEKIQRQEAMLEKKLVPPEAAEAIRKQKVAADKYADDLLAKLEASIERSLKVVRNGKSAINQKETAKV